MAGNSACYLCQSRHLTVRKASDSYSYVWCRSCGLRRQDPVPEPGALKILYHGDYYDDRGLDRSLDDQPAFVRDLIGRRVGALTSLCGGACELLDVGCGTGLFLEAAVRKGWKAAGVEISEASLSYASRFTSARLIHGELGDLAIADPYDAITFWDVLEHLPDPREELRLAHGRLKRGGVIGVSLPNVSGLKARLQRDGWRYYQPSMGHISHFSPSTLARLLTQGGFRVIRVETRGAFNLWKLLGQDPITVRESRPALDAIQRLADNGAGLAGLGETITAWARRA